MKWIKSIKIRGFRGISTYQTLKLAIPDNEHEGSGMTVMVGPNSGGKSSVIEALSLAGQPNGNIVVSDDARNVKNEGKVEVRIRLTDKSIIEIDNSKQKFKLSVVNDNNAGNLKGKIYSVPSRRQLEKNFGESRSKRSQYSEDSARLRIDRNEFPKPIYRIFTLAENSEQKQKFDEVLSKILGFDIVWEIDHGQGGYYLKINTINGSHGSTGMGFGIVSILFVLDAFRDLEEGDIVLIDEPELSQHPSVQRRLCKFLLEKSKSNQVIIATHSPYFVETTAIQNGLEVARVVSTSRYGTKVFQLSESGKQSVSSLTNDLNNPHTIGNEAKEVFFLDEKVVLTEGQEDVVLLPKLSQQINEELNFSMYGWGVGGADKMKHVCTILQDLGINKFAGLLDKDKESLKDSLKREFPRAEFFVLPADDIRDKESQHAKDRKIGLSGTNGVIKDKYVDDFRTLIQHLNSF